MFHNQEEKQMQDYNKYCRTDLADEAAAGKDGGKLSGVMFREETESGMKIGILDILDENGAGKIGKPVGRYITVYCGQIHRISDEETETAAGVIADKLASMAEALTGKRKEDSLSVLIAGLGNRRITADAIGPGAAERITVTRHLKTESPELFGSIGCASVCAISPGVLAQTGLEACEQLTGIKNSAQPDLVIVIDALAARSCDRLASTVQLSDNGLSPGSGVGNRRRAVTSAELGCPVISLGVPTIVDSSTLVYDALDRAGIGEISDELNAVLENGRNFFVTPKETDFVTEKISVLLAKAVNYAFFSKEIEI